MGQKIHPVGMRLGITRTWDSRWFEKKHYVDWLHEDVAIRKSFNRWMRSASISKIEIERRANQARVIVNTAKPGIIIGKRGVGIDDIRKNLERLTGKTIAVNVMEISHPELDARLVAQNIVDQLEKRIAFRRAMKQAIMRTMRAGARGIKVQVSGRLGGAEIARTEHNADGKVPLHTLRADIDYAQVEAFTTFGRIGVKVWIYRGEVLPDQPRGEGALPRTGDRGRDRRERGGRGRGREPRMPQAAPPAARVAAEPAEQPMPTEPASELVASIAPESAATTAPETAVTTAPETAVTTAPESAVTTAPEPVVEGSTAPAETASAPGEVTQ
jgi:small subunit ribosomal protein S3